MVQDNRHNEEKGRFQEAETSMKISPTREKRRQMAPAIYRLTSATPS
jgi:hypothetical protein